MPCAASVPVTPLQRSPGVGREMNEFVDRQRAERKRASTESRRGPGDEHGRYPPRRNPVVLQRSPGVGREMNPAVARATFSITML